jgi:hypothetical protein
MIGGVQTGEMCCLAQIDSGTLVICLIWVARRSNCPSTGRDDGAWFEG